MHHCVYVSMKVELCSAFNTSYLGSITFFLGMHIIHGRLGGAFHSHQSNFAADLLQSYGFENVKTICTPRALKTKHFLYDTPSDPVSKVHCLIGRFHYLVSCPCFDLCFSINYLSRYMHNPSITHWYSLKRSVKYLQDTKLCDICYAHSVNHDPSLQLLAWLDSIWEGGDRYSKI
ncbi:hypothetical protein KP509_38G061600 [Ceratopteris richardii]|uniref:Retrovirus-related Pol polyprotein from transposon TNT 1-94 n=1 Tax=Ceratopteris richardii TaxID=49495 RepID=A0A8T2Q5F3_CERRI|nr:hypothetical protein KP509_38G061600 [Ceratopteris richardii]